MNADRPPLLLVTGAPASGKTGLSRRLAQRYGLPLLARDGFKEVLFDTLGSPDRDASRALGPVAFALLYASIGWLLDADVGVVVDSNFHHGHSEEHLTPLIARARPVLLHCEAALDVRAARHIERAAHGARHPGHHDEALPAEVQANVAAGLYDPLDLPAPLLRIDTSHGYDPPLDEIERFVNRALG